jgi:hypothetical protein
MPSGHKCPTLFSLICFYTTPKGYTQGRHILLTFRCTLEMDKITAHLSGWLSYELCNGI